jgi:hypothetical protein
MEASNKKEDTDAPAALGISYKGVIERLEKVSDRLSAQTRTLALGILAFSWGLLVGQSTVANEIAVALRWHLLAIGVLAIVALFLDFLQYAFGYAVADRLRRAMEGTKTDLAEYDYRSLPYRAQNYCFIGKQGFLIVAATWLVIAIAAYAIIRLFQMS